MKSVSMLKKFFISIFIAIFYSCTIQASDDNWVTDGNGNTTTTGNVGIGLSPNYDFDIQTSVADLRIKSTTLNQNATLRLQNDAREWTMRVNGSGTGLDYFQIVNSTAGRISLSIDQNDNIHLNNGNLILNSNYLSNDGDNEGIQIGNDGDVKFSKLNNSASLNFNGWGGSAVKMTSSGALGFSSGNIADIVFHVNNGIEVGRFDENEGTFRFTNTNIEMNNNFISNDGDDEGLQISDSGIASFSGNIECNGAFIGRLSTTTLRTNTTTGNDEKSVAISGGGGISSNRGSYIVSYGENHAISPGMLKLVAGSAGNINLQGTINTNNNYISGDGDDEGISIDSNGQVCIGTSTTSPVADAKLTVAGKISARDITIKVDAGADFVFKNDYALPSLAHVEKYVLENKHLPEIPSAKEMQENGVQVSEMQIKLLQKIEELTLHMIEMNKKIEKLEKNILLKTK